VKCLHLPARSPCSPDAARSAPDARRLVTAFLSGRNARTVKAYSQDLADFQAFIGVATVDAAAKVLLSDGRGAANQLALSYKTHLVERGLQAATINRRLAALRSLTHLARTFGAFSAHTTNVVCQCARSHRALGRTFGRQLS